MRLSVRTAILSACCVLAATSAVHAQVSWDLISPTLGPTHENEIVALPIYAVYGAQINPATVFVNSAEPAQNLSIRGWGRVTISREFLLDVPTSTWVATNVFDVYVESPIDGSYVVQASGVLPDPQPSSFERWFNWFAFGFDQVFLRLPFMLMLYLIWIGRHGIGHHLGSGVVRFVQKFCRAISGLRLSPWATVIIGVAILLFLAFLSAEAMEVFVEILRRVTAIVAVTAIGVWMYWLSPFRHESKISRSSLLVGAL